MPPRKSKWYATKPGVRRASNLVRKKFGPESDLLELRVAMQAFSGGKRGQLDHDLNSLRIKKDRLYSRLAANVVCERMKITDPALKAIIKRIFVGHAHVPQTIKGKKILTNEAINLARYLQEFGVDLKKFAEVSTKVVEEIKKNN
jgi:hypothetical protein